MVEKAGLTWPEHLVLALLVMMLIIVIVLIVAHKRGG